MARTPKWMQDLTVEERHELELEDAALDAAVATDEASDVAAYRTMICSLGQAVKATTPAHPMILALRTYYAACTSRTLITGHALLAGKSTYNSIKTIVDSCQHRGIAVAAYWSEYVSE